MYEQHRMLEDQEIQHWLKNELFSVGWFVMVGIVAVYYIVWLKKLDKSRAKDLLLIGALGAVFFHINIMVLSEITGLVEYHIRDLPIQDTLFLSSTTLAPITIMIVQQHTTSWKGYILWSAIGMAFMCFGVFEILYGFRSISISRYLEYLLPFSRSFLARIAHKTRLFVDSRNAKEVF